MGCSLDHLRLGRVEEQLVLCVEHPIYGLPGEDRAFQLAEDAHVLLLEPPGPQSPPLLGEELGAYARHLLGAHPESLPLSRVAACPLFVEDAALAVGGREHDEGPTRYREHGPYGEVEFVLHACGLIHYQEGDAAEAPDSLLCARQRDYS